MRILIVDDEQAIRDYFVTALDWKGQGYELYEAENGQEALTLLQEKHMDLVLLDITMPVMNGLDVLDWIHVSKYECVVSLLTCHDEFRYAKEALTKGCFDYMLKSELESNHLSDLIQRMSEVASEDAKQKQYYAALETSALRKENLELQSRIQYWLKTELDSNEEMTAFFEEKLQFYDEKYNYVLLEINIHDYLSVVQRYTNNDNVHFLTLFDWILCELLEKHHFFYLQPEEGSFLAFLKFEKGIPMNQIIGKVHNTAEHIDDNLRKLLQIHSCIVYTLPFLGITNSHAYFRKMNQLKALTFFSETDQILCIEDYIFDTEICKEFLKNFETRFQSEIILRNLAQIEQSYHDTVKQIVERLFCISPSDFMYVCERCVTKFLMSCSEDAGNSAMITKRNNSEEFGSTLLNLLAPFCIPDSSQEKKTIVKKAILLIQQNYSDDIGLEWLADKLCVNSSYLSRLFSQEIGKSLTSYINQYRIEKAKKLIESSNLKLYEIAEKSGFSSSIVFSSAFKKLTGETPTEYRNRTI